MNSNPLEKIDDYRWRLPASYKPGMRVSGLVYASESMLPHVLADKALEQVANVAFLPGIVGPSLAMPDIHWGYGFPIGGVAATRLKDGVISPGGVGFDINCGVRILRTRLTEAEVRPVIRELVEALFQAVPSGVGSSGIIHLKAGEIDDVLASGSQWAVRRGYGRPEDLVTTEDGGCAAGADPSHVSKKARERGVPQLGTLGSGNHFLEVAVVDQVHDRKAAAAMGIEHAGQVVILVHCGSRGLGYQVCEDHVRVMVSSLAKYGISLPDRQLACAPIASEEGKAYLSAMRGAANYAWANRQCITHRLREAVAAVMRKNENELGLDLIYDVAHNIAKIEEHLVEGAREMLCVHRKGATRAFPPGHPGLPPQYREIGQPVLIPGDMGRFSYVLVGADLAMKETFGSTCHGAGRMQSRKAARRQVKGQDIIKELASRGITVRTGSIGDLAEESSEAYKDIASVIDVAHNSGLSRMVFRTRPMGVIKG
ncbi:MAG: RtcB family protein [Chloroflexi bacterium]|nr:RtcB family protein [Chloroflexota bacterium]